MELFNQAGRAWEQRMQWFTALMASLCDDIPFTHT